MGDPTEIALLAIAGKIGLRKEPLSKSYKRIHEIPFSSERKMMSTINSFNGKSFMFTKGAPDTILKYCTKICINNKVLPLTKELKNNILKANEEFANQALRVLGFAYKEAKDYNEKGLVFVGLQGMIDPPRKEVKKSIELLENIESPYEIINKTNENAEYLQKRYEKLMQYSENRQNDNGTN